jgi:hypothetical protein
VRSVTLKRPFTGGIVTDVPAHELAPNLSPYTQDGYSPSGVFRQRGGWEYYGSSQVLAANLKGIYRATFVLADENRDIAITTNSAYIHNGSSSGTIITATGSTLVPRCVYRDELLLCSQDGLTPLIRYSGASNSSIVESSGTATFTADEATITGPTWSGTPPSGSYISTLASASPTRGILSVRTSFKVLTGSTTSVTLDGVLASSTAAINETEILPVGYAYPCVGVYNAGTSINNVSTAQSPRGQGTKWNSDYTRKTNDAFLYLPVGLDAEIAHIESVTSDTQLSTVHQTTYTTKSSYSINRALPFKDAQAHKGSLWGTGVAQYPNRVYVSPPGWNMSLPPGATDPWDPYYGVGNTSSNANDFFLDFIDVPASTDGDHNIAILPTSNPLLVLKRRAVYGVFGSFPTFTVEMVADGIGCIDIRSAQSYDEGQFWCGESGIFWYRGGQVTDLTAGRINREWRELTRDFDYGTNDYCSLAVVQGHLIVHITTGGGVTQRTYLCSLADGSWQSRVSNFTPRFMFTSRLPGEAEKCLAVSDARQGRVIDFAPALDGSGTAEDDAGSAPRLVAYTPEGIDGSSIEDDTRMVDLAVHANVYDVGSDGDTSMTVSVVTQDSLTSADTATKTLSDIDSDSTDRIDRHYFRSVNRRGRRHQVRLEVDTLGTDASTTKVEVHQIDAAFRETRNRS